MNGPSDLNLADPRHGSGAMSTTEVIYEPSGAIIVRSRCCQLRRTDADGQRWTFDGPARLGSAPDNDVVLSDETVSRHHCRISREPDGWLVQDSGSTNGTCVDHVRIREAFLQPGCTIGLGKVELEFSAIDREETLEPSGRDRLGLLTGQAPAMKALYAVIERIAPTGASVIITGETGTGKEVVAQTLHSLSPRANAPFEVFDCGATASSLILSELFGHEKGSFTGALTGRVGVVERAEGGTLFLDEIGELPLDVQPSLLRFVDRMEFRRIGSRQTLRADVRVIAATHRDLAAAVRAQRFREDLFYRLHVVRLVVPALRDRRGDIPLLASQVLERDRMADAPERAGRGIRLSPAALRVLAQHHWPGNVRELANVLARARSLCRGPTIGVAELPDELRLEGRPRSDESSSHGGADYRTAKDQLLRSFERRFLLEQLERHGGNVSQAARSAGMARRHFYNLLNKHGVEPSGGSSDADADDSSAEH